MSAPLRFVTASSLFDGHDASINIVRRVLQASGAEVIHLGHNRSVEEIVTAAIQEDVQGIAVSSYQGGHNEYFRFMVDMLRERDAGGIKLFVGGGGVITPQEIEALEAYGVARIYSAEVGQRLGLQGMIEDMMQRCGEPRDSATACAKEELSGQGWERLPLWLTALENGALPTDRVGQLRAEAAERPTPVVGITGTGGAGKSSVTDELVRRFRLDQSDRMRIAILAIDPSRRKSGGALLGDRIRMNGIDSDRIYMRSVATRAAEGGLPASAADMIAALKVAGADLVIVETPGIGQGDAGIVPLVDLSIYVMTPEFGAPSQLEKIDMLDFADLVIINKFDRRGAEDAYRDVCKQVQRNREAFDDEPASMPVFGTIASRFNDDGITAAYQGLVALLAELGAGIEAGALSPVSVRCSTRHRAIVPPGRTGYLSEIAGAVRGYRTRTEEQSRIARELQQLREVRGMLAGEDESSDALATLIDARERRLDREAQQLLDGWPQVQARYGEQELTTTVRDREIRSPLTHKTLSENVIPRVALPRARDHGDLLRWLMLESLPGTFPFTAGVFALKREEEQPTRMFAGEGDPFRTNRRFKALSAHGEAKRLSTAFDSVTLYGCDPDERPDIFGKIGNAGVSIATLDDLKALYDGFDLTDPMTSVSMTINGPAPTILAMFFNAAIDQQLAGFEEREGRLPSDEERARIRAETLRTVRGTVQADILKEDQGQNTCIFSTEFALRMMADIQEFFVAENVRNFYSVSISGYHIAEAGANPITQLAFTLANGFTYVEAYRARGMAIDDFAPNLSFFFSNGMEPEYAVLGRVARRIWAIAMRDLYGGGERSQKLKYHIQTSGRSLHAQEMSYNDIRTTLQALNAVYDNCNSLHTNAYDEAVTTPTEESVRRALAIQLIINQEWGLAKNENPMQGSFIVEQLTDLVEEAVLAEFDRISSRGGVLGAMESGYQRSRIQEESLVYERRKHDGSLPLIGVNTFLADGEDVEETIPLARSTLEERNSQIERLNRFKTGHRDRAQEEIARLKRVAVEGGNLFEVLMDAVRHCTLGEISEALFEVGGEYRRNM